MQTQQNGPAPRGVQGRPNVSAKPKTGEARVSEIFIENKVQIMGLLATEGNVEAAFLRAQALAVAAYRKVQADSDVHIDELSMCATCLWALRQKLDVGTEVWTVPYAGKITPIVSPDGLLTLLTRSGLVRDVNWSAVFEGDEFEYVLGTTNEIKHRKNGPRPLARMVNGKVQKNDELWNVITGVWCVINLKNGGQIAVVFNKSELERFRSMSPSGTSASSPWAKFGDAMAEVRAMKRAAKRAPKSVELSAILLSAEDSDGVEIPDEIMKAVGARMLADMTGEPPPTNGGVEPPPNTQHSTRATVHKPGDAKALPIPGRSPQPTIYQADNDKLLYWEAKMRADFDANAWPEKFFEKNVTQLATIRLELRERNVEIPPHASFDAGLPTTPEQEPAYDYQGGGQEEPGANG